jgi:hypothetical protein
MIESRQRWSLPKRTSGPVAEVRTQAMTSQDVNRALREVVWPALKRNGFGGRTARTAWRDRPDQIDVVNFESFNAYNAGVLRVTTYSFQVNLGTYPRCRATDRTTRKGADLRPAEYNCDFRHQLRKTIVQPETDRDTLWFVSPDGSNLDEVVAGAKSALLAEGLAWFAQLEGLDNLLRAARHVPMDMDGTWGMGNFGSPHRLELISALEAATAPTRSLSG